MKEIDSPLFKEDEGDVDEENVIEEEEMKELKKIARISFNKTWNKYTPIFDIWKDGEEVPYLSLSKAFDEIQKTKSKLLHIEIMREYFYLVLEKSPDDLLKAIYLSTNKLAPQYEGVELGLGESLIQKAMVKATGKNIRQIQAEYKKLGDLGEVALASGQGIRTLMKPKPLTLKSVFQTLHSIAKEKGQGTQNKKIDKIRMLLVSCREREVLYIIKTLQSKMRINLGPKSIMAAVAHALAFHEYKDSITPEILQNAQKIVATAFSELPNWECIIENSLKYGLNGVQKYCKLTIGIPSEPMLAKPTNGIADILKRLQGHDIFTAEFKYDGERAQIHYLSDDNIKIYTRNLENQTSKYPDVISNIKKAFKNVNNVILDCEVVAFDSTTNKILPFQILATRSRKEVKLEEIKVKVCLFLFDILYLNGESLLKKQLAERRQIMKEHIMEITGELYFAKSQEFTDTEDLEQFLQDAVENQCEGLMIKTFNKNSEYEPSKRSYHWLKLKKDYMDGMTDSVDLVPIGAWYGKGKRAGKYSSILLACYNEDSEEFQSVCKTGTGFSDIQFAEFTEQLEKYTIPQAKSYYSVGEALKPDVWFEPSIVWEVKIADLSISPLHKGAIGMVSQNKGIGLRFPRFIRVREDKNPEQATSAQQIAEMYYAQKIHHVKEADDDDDY